MVAVGTSVAVGSNVAVGAAIGNTVGEVLGSGMGEGVGTAVHATPINASKVRNITLRERFIGTPHRSNSIKPAGAASTPCRDRFAGHYWEIVRPEGRLVHLCNTGLNIKQQRTH